MLPWFQHMSTLQKLGLLSKWMSVRMMWLVMLMSTLQNLGLLSVRMKEWMSTLQLGLLSVRMTEFVYSAW